MNNKNLTIEISLKSVFSIIAIILFLLLAWKIRAIIFALVISLILMSGSSPLVDWFQKKGLNKVAAVVFTYLLAIGTFGLILFAVLPPLITRSLQFTEDLPIYVTILLDTLNNSEFIALNSEDVARILSERAQEILFEAQGLLLNVFSGFITFITVAIFTFYLLLEKEKLKNNMFYFFPHLPKDRVTLITHKIEEKLGAWVRGQFLLMVIIGVTTWIGLTLLRVEFALPLAVLAGTLEVVAIIGPIVAAVPAIIIAFVQFNSPIPALGVVALYVLIQQLENNLIVPKLMEKAVGVHPLAIIFALLVGGSLFGIIGAVLAVPIAATIQVILEDIHDHAK